MGTMQQNCKLNAIISKHWLVLFECRALIHSETQNQTVQTHQHAFKATHDYYKTNKVNRAPTAVCQVTN